MVLKPIRDHILSAHSDPIDLGLIAKMCFDDFINSIKEDGRGGFTSNIWVCQEIHPYSHFREKMSKNPRGYILGTFPPASYLRSQLYIDNKMIGDRPFKVNEVEVRQPPKLNFFHGNKNELWRRLGIEDLSEIGILNFLNETGWVYSDVIFSCHRDSIDSPADGSLDNIVPNFELINEILSKDSRLSLWFTSSSIFNTTGIRFDGENFEKIDVSQGQAFDIFIRSLQELGYEISISKDGKNWVDVRSENSQRLSSSYVGLIYLSLKINSKIYDVFFGPSPSGSASRHMKKHSLFIKWRESLYQKGIQISGAPTNDFRSFIYQNIISKNIPLLNDTFQ